MSKVKTGNPGLIVMVRPDSRSLRLSAFTKWDGEKSWSKYHESVPIPLSIMLPSAAAPLVADAGASASAVADMGLRRRWRACKLTLPPSKKYLGG